MIGRLIRSIADAVQIIAGLMLVAIVLINGVNVAGR